MVWFDADRVRQRRAARVNPGLTLPDVGAMPPGPPPFEPEPLPVAEAPYVEPDPRDPYVGEGEGRPRVADRPQFYRDRYETVRTMGNYETPTKRQMLGEALMDVGAAFS